MMFQHPMGDHMHPSNRAARFFRQLNGSILSLLLVVVVWPSIGRGDEWKAGFAAANITPDKPLRLAGYGSRERENVFEGVNSDLFAKALTLQDKNGHLALLLTCDLVGLTKDVSALIYDGIAKQTNLKRNQILINFSHTHAGPDVGLDDDELSFLKNAEHIALAREYTQKLVKQLIRIGVKSGTDLQPASLEWGTGVASFVMNRREFTERGVRLGVNPRGRVDRSVPVVRITSDGKLRCVIVGTACHNTTLKGNAMNVSGDYAGYVQQYLERELPGVQAMFVQGCGGDANPFPLGTEEIARQHGRTLTDEVLRVLKTNLTPISGPLQTVTQSISLPLQTSLSDATYDKLERASGSTRNVASRLRELAKKGEPLPQAYTSEVSLWQFGDDLTLVALPGEVVVDYVQAIADAIGHRKLWVSAYCHDVFGYIPSTRVLREGGYEIRGVYYGAAGIFASEVESTLVDRVRAMSKEVKRQVKY